jgi:hypothetical protein
VYRLLARRSFPVGRGVVGPEFGLPNCQRLLAELLGFGRTAEGMVAVGQIFDADDRVGVVWVELGLAKV